MPYRHLAAKMMDIPFRARLEGDKNRAADGESLRRRYSDVPSDGCTVMEMLVGLSQRMTFMDGEDEAYWFETFIVNLGLGWLDDIQWESRPHESEEGADRIIRNWMDRKFESDGSGGLFPLDHPEYDQRDVEIWYQANAYLMEKNEKM